VTLLSDGVLHLQLPEQARLGLRAFWTDKLSCGDNLLLANTSEIANHPSLQHQMRRMPWDMLFGMHGSIAC